MRTTADRAPLRARKRFGQHFLEPAWVRKVVEAIAPGAGDTFLEIGPGPGALTRPLLAAARAVVACEIDRDLAAALRDEQFPNLTVIEGDFLQLPSEALRLALAAACDGDATGVRVAGNLPYNVASPILFRLMEHSAAGLPLRDATVMLQREVAERLLASPGTGEYGVLAARIGHRAHVDRLLQLPPGAFRPMPKVYSMVVRLRFHAPDPPVVDEALFGEVVQAIFTRRRKTMSNALLAWRGLSHARAADALAAAGIDPVRRPETLSIPELVRLSDTLAAQSTRD